MKKLFFFAATVFSVVITNAQKIEMIELTPGSTTHETLNGDIYIYPGYLDGLVLFNNGRSGKSRMNYCFLTNEMLFINPKGDTLALTGENEVRYAVIGKDTFYYDGMKFLKQEKAYDWIKTASYLTIKEVNRKRKGGYGETIMGAATNVTSINADQLLFAVKSSDYVTLRKETTYYIGDASNQFTPLKKDNFLKLVPAAKLSAVKDLLKKSPVDFGNLEQVNDLIARVSQL